MDKKFPNLNLTPNHQSYICLAIGFLFSLFANGMRVIPIATWISFVFLLRFVRTQKPLRGYTILIIALSITYFSYWNSAFKIIIPYFYLVAILAGIMNALPFLLDRLISPHSQGILSTFTFPLTWTTFAFFNSCITGSWYSLAYTQYGNLPLMQVASVTGIYGIGFLIIWFASVVNFAWEKDFEWKKVGPVIKLFSFVLIAIIFLGGLRLSFFPPKTDTVRIATIKLPDILPAYLDYKETKSLPTYEKSLEILQNTLEKATLLGAKIIFWNEFAFLISADKEEEFITHASRIAQTKGVYALLAMGVFGQNHGENKTVLLSPSGEIEFKYSKQKPVAGLETPYILTGTEKPSIANTPYGKISSLICADIDYTDLVRKVGKENIDILLAPSLDWKELNPLHTHMAVFRAIENGFSLIRGNGGGLSIAVDYQGRTLALIDHSSNDKIMISDIPTKGISTIYSKIGDVFALICLLGFVSLIIRMIWLKQSKKILHLLILKSH